MTGDAVDQPPSSPALLTLGRVDVVRLQVGYRAGPESPPYQQFLLDLPVPDPDDKGGPAFGEQEVLAALEPVLHVGADAPRHYSLHQHRWHTSWGASPGALEIGLLVTTGTRTTALTGASDAVVVEAFRDLLKATGPREAETISRDAAVLRARRSAATAFGVDADTLSLSTEQHNPAENSWAVGLRTTSGDEYDVLVGLVDGYAGSVRLLHDRRTEVLDALGTE